MWIQMSATFICGFIVFILAMLLLDLFVFNRKAHAVSVKEALAWSVVWVLLALAFNAAIFWHWDWMAPNSTHTAREAGITFFTGYILEEALSVDNLFVFVLIFQFFKVRPEFQHRVLFWGVIGAWVMRGIMIFLGAALVTRFEWILYIFGAFLLFSGAKMAMMQEGGAHPENNPLVKFARKLIPISPDYDGKKFFTRRNGVLMATPLFLVLLVVETSDLVFAMDSIPAIFSVTTDATIIFTSNVFAILGLRSLYFVLASMMDRFHMLKYGLSIVLCFVGLKMLVAHWVHIDVVVSLVAIASILTVSVALSLAFPKKLAE
jgi:tellurite resistance protein TerC